MVHDNKKDPLLLSSSGDIAQIPRTTSTPAVFPDTHNHTNNNNNNTFMATATTTSMNTATASEEERQAQADTPAGDDACGDYLDGVMGVETESPVVNSNADAGITLPKKTSGVFGASSNLINSIVGAGIIGLPYAFRQSGLVAGLVLLLIVAYLTGT